MLPKISRSEELLAICLKRLQVDFKQQFSAGPYTADFLLEPNIVVECEGIVHCHQQEYDMRRSSELEAMGYRVWRLPNYSVFQDPLGIAKMLKDAQRRAVWSVIA